jgi:hypothetical protein
LRNSNDDETCHIITCEKFLSLYYGLKGHGRYLRGGARELLLPGEEGGPFWMRLLAVLIPAGEEKMALVRCWNIEEGVMLERLRMGWRKWKLSLERN